MERNEPATSISGFICGAFLLHYGKDLFNRHFTILARRFNVPETLTALLTLGAEWEELAIVVSSTLQSHPQTHHQDPSRPPYALPLQLALGNILGSTITNILFSFSFGLILHRIPIKFERNAKIYASTLVIVSSFFLYLSLSHRLDMTGGILFLVAFAVYIMSIFSAIYDKIIALPTPMGGSLAVPIGNRNTYTDLLTSQRTPNPKIDTAIRGARDNISDAMSSSSTAGGGGDLAIAIFPTVIQANPTATTPLIPPPPLRTASSFSNAPEPERSLFYHLIKLSFSFLALSFSSYTLLHTSLDLSTYLSLPPYSFGLTILSLAATLPEKIPAAILTWRGHQRRMVMSTAGANIFLLTLCVGIVFVVGNGERELMDCVKTREMWVVWGGAMCMGAVVVVGGRRWVGFMGVGAWIAFLGAEGRRFWQ